MRGYSATLAVAATVVVALAAFPGGIDLLDPDEGRHGEIAREMLADGHYLTPRIHGRPYHDKPVFFHWTLAASMAVFGENAAAVRLPSMVAALWTIAVTAWWAARAYSPSVARLAALGLATTLGFFAIGRWAIIDMVFTAALSTAAAWLGAWHADGEGEKRSILPFYVFAGLGTLIKGPVALVLTALMALALALAAEHRVKTLAALRPAAGSAVALGVALPWYLAAWLHDRVYVETFLWRHNFERYAQGFTDHHSEPWYYYLVALPLCLLPWTPAVVAAAASRLRSARRSPADLYAAIWAAVIILFFLPARTKLVTYMLPALPPLLCLAAAWATDERTRRHPPAGLWGWSVLWSALVAALCIAASLWACSLVPEATAGVAAAALLALAVAACAWFRGRSSASMCGACLAASSLALVLFLYGPFASAVNAVRSLRPAAEIVSAELGPGSDLASYRITPHSVAFYARRTVRRADSAAQALVGLSGPAAAALLTKEKYLGELGLSEQNLPPGTELRWRGRRGAVLLLKR